MNLLLIHNKGNADISSESIVVIKNIRKVGIIGKSV